MGSVTATEYRSRGDQFAAILAMGANGATPEILAEMAGPSLDWMFPGSDRAVVESRLNGWFDRYLETRYGSALSMSKTAPQPSRQNVAALVAVAELNAATDRRIEELKSQAKASILAIDGEIQLHRQRTTITALCTMAGVPERAERYVRGDLLSVAEVRRMLFNEVLSVRNTPASDDPAGECRESSRDPNAELRAEYHQHRAIHERLGIDEGRYIASRRKEIETAKKG